MTIIPKLALAVQQPWAWAIIHAGKDIENRSAHAITFGSMKPGPLAIYASRTMSRIGYELARKFMMEKIGIEPPKPLELKRGFILGHTVVDDIVKEHASPWWMGPRGLVLRDTAALATPVPCSGLLGFYEWKLGAHGPAPTPPWMHAWPQRPTQPEIDARNQGDLPL